MHHGLSKEFIALFSKCKEIQVERNIGDFLLNAKQIFPVGIIINELLTNVMKHAFTTKDAGLVRISFIKIGNQVTLSIEDNGTGLPEDFDFNTNMGFGIMLIKILSEQLGGSYKVESKTGTLTTIEFKI